MFDEPLNAAVDGLAIFLVLVRVAGCHVRKQGQAGRRRVGVIFLAARGQIVGNAGWRIVQAPMAVGELRAGEIIEAVFDGRFGELSGSPVA